MDQTMKVKMILAALALIMTVGLSAQTPQKTAGTNQTRTCYVDKNNNNICDRLENGTCVRNNRRGNNNCQRNAICDGTGRQAGKGKGRGCGLRDGSGRANGGKGTYYVDKNNNGICDNREATTNGTK